MSLPVADAVPTPLGLRVKKLRETANIDQMSLSVAVGKSKAVIYQLERGIIIEPSAGLLMWLSKVLGTTPEYLYFGEGKRPPLEKILASLICHADKGAAPAETNK